MQVMLEVPQAVLDQLDERARAREMSRDDLVRTYIAESLRSEPSVPKQRDDSLDEAFGMWAHRKEEVLMFYEQLRSEWDRTF